METVIANAPPFLWIMAAILATYFLRFFLKKYKLSGVDRAGDIRRRNFCLFLAGMVNLVAHGFLFFLVLYFDAGMNALLILLLASIGLSLALGGDI